MSSESYIINLFLFLLYSTLIKKSNINKKNSLIFITSVIHLLFFQSIFENDKLLDSQGYIDAFEDVHYFSLSEVIIDGLLNEWGVGFMLYNKLVSYITNDAHLYYIVTYAVIDIPLLWYFYKVSKNYTLSLVLYLFHPMLFWDSNYILRQHMAMSLSAIALYYSNKKKFAIPMSIMAASMHFTAMVLLPFLIWKELNLSKASFRKIIYLMILSFLFLGMLLYQILAQSARYSMYIDSDKSSQIMPFLLLVPLAIFLFAKRKFFYNSVHDSNLLSFLLYGVVITLFSMNSPFGRITTYFIVFVPAAVPLLFKCSFKNEVFLRLFVLLLLSLEGYMLYKSCTSLYKGNLML